MARRNFSMIEYLNRRAAGWQPLLGFRGTTRDDWQEWRAAALTRLLDLLGEFPAKADLDAEVVCTVEEDGIIRERVVFDAEETMSVPCVVLRPVHMPKNRKGRAILCCHGHGPFGKEPVAGNATTPELAAHIKSCNYNYGEQMARHGFLAICPDLRGFGERSDGGNPYPGRDRCNVHFIRGAVLGIYTLTLNIFDMMRCLDYLETRPEVDPERIGMMGLSQGGTMTTFTAAVEPRVRAADIIGYVNPWDGFGIRRANFCGSQIVPEVYRHFDTHDIAGLIAPRPLLLEMGFHDTCFLIEDLLEGYQRTKVIYDAAGAAERLWTEVHPGGHAFAGGRAFEFFDRHL